MYVIDFYTDLIQYRTDVCEEFNKLLPDNVSLWNRDSTFNKNKTTYRFQGFFLYTDCDDYIMNEPPLELLRDKRITYIDSYIMCSKQGEYAIVWTITFKLTNNETE